MAKKQMNKHIVLLLILILNTFNISAQKAKNWSLDEILQKAIRLTKGDSLIADICFDSVSTIRDFDFSSFEKADTNYRDLSIHKVYYKKSEICALERIDTVNKLYNYFFRVNKENGIIILNGYSDNFDFFDGVIVIVEKTKNIYFICLDYNSKNEQYISYIMKLNKHLFPISKMHFYQNCIDYYSKFEYNKDANILNKERINLSFLTCKERPYLLKDIELFFKQQNCTYYFSSVIPDVRDYSLPFWFYGNYRYEN